MAETDFDWRKENRLIDLGFGAVTAPYLTRLREEQNRPVRAIPTGILSWDEACHGAGGRVGLGRGWYVVLTGRTGAGKTMLALNMVLTALKAGESVLFITLEMSVDQLLTRLRPMLMGDHINFYEPGPAFDLSKTIEADRAFMELPGALYVNHEPIWRLTDVRAAVESYAARGVRLVVLDYAQLVVPDGSDARLFEAMTRTSAELRHAAKVTGCTAVVLSQLNRSATMDKKSPPDLDGLYGSGRFAFDADQVVALDYSHREYDKISTTESTRLLLLKNRHGPARTGDQGINITIDYKNFRVEERFGGGW